MPGRPEFISTAKITLDIQDNFISFTEFIVFVLLDLGLIILSILFWRVLWYSLNRLYIHDLTQGEPTIIGSSHSFSKYLSSLQIILKNIAELSGYVINNCGYEAYTYLYFLRRFAQTMAILLITDLCIWLPYMLFFQPFNQFSLVNMPSAGNDLFRTFYTLWVAVIILYSINTMRLYLRAHLKYHLFRNQTLETRLLNNLKTKTVYLHFVGSCNEITPLNIKTKLIDEYHIEDRIVAVQRIHNQSEQLNLEYREEIQKIIRHIGIINLSRLWRLFKEETNSIVELQWRENIQHYRIINRLSLTEKTFNCYFVIFENIETAETLCNEFETNRALCGWLSILFGCSPAPQRLIAKWAQEPQDIMWINMGSESSQLFKHTFFNVLSVILLIISLSVIVITSSRNILVLPKVLGPLFIVLVNSILRYLISKASQWENKLFQYELQIKEFSMITVFLIINVLIGSLVRDTLNLLDILQTGWGWLELLGLLYQRTDGYFYYLFICNEIALNAFSTLIKVGGLALDVFEPLLFYEKTRVKHQSKYGTNDPFRYGYSYSCDVIVLSIILMYSTSNPLMHFFGLLYFLSRFYLSGYTLTLFHKQEETSSNLRLIEQVISVIEIVLISWIFLTAITMMFDKNYSNVLILYISLGGITYFIFARKDKTTLKDYATDEELEQHDLTNVVAMWKNIYKNELIIPNGIDYEEEEYRE